MVESSGQAVFYQVEAVQHLGAVGGGADLDVAFKIGLERIEIFRILIAQDQGDLAQRHLAADVAFDLVAHVVSDGAGRPGRRR